MNETTNENNPEETQETASLAEEQNPEVAVSEDENTHSDKGNVPYYRFKEKIDEVADLKEQVKTLNDVPIEEEEPLDWKEAEERAVKKATLAIEQKFVKEKDNKRQKDQNIENAFSQLKQIGQDITPDIKKVVLEKMIKTGNPDVINVYLEMKDRLAEIAKTEQIKTEGKIPSSNKGPEEKVSGLPYSQLKNMSLDEMIGKAE